MDDSFPTEQRRFMASNHDPRERQTQRGNRNSADNNVPTPTHGRGFASNNHTNIPYDWMGYGNFGGGNYYGGRPEFSHPYSYPHHNPYYCQAPYSRYQGHDAIDRNSSSFDEIPSPPNPHYSNHGNEGYASHLEAAASTGHLQHYPPQFSSTHQDSMAGQPSASSTMVTPLRSPRHEGRNVLPTEASGTGTSAMHSFTSKPSPRDVHDRKPSGTNTRTKNSSSSNVIWELEEYDVLCGRGAPTNYHSGNLFLRKLVAAYQTIYLCSKRSDKPGIAWKLLDIVTARGGRFVRRSTNFAWEQLNDKQAYEKVCQALREGAPELRRRMLQDMRGGRIRELEGDEHDENSTRAVAGQDQENSQEEDGKEYGDSKASIIRTRSSAAKKKSDDDVYAI